MNKALWSKKALAIPACTALIVGGITLSATAAHADPADFAVTNTAVSGQVLTVTGTGTPGENVILQKGFPAERQEIPADGKWTITYTLPDQAQHTYEIDQQIGFNADGSATITVQAEQAAPAFAITSHSVSGRTVTVSGTGNPDDTVQIDPQSAPIVRHAIADDGTWSFTFDIPGTDTDEHTYSVLEENSNFQIQDRGSFTAAAEPAASDPAAQFSLTSPADGSTVSSRTVTFTGTGTPGDLVNTLDADGNRAAPQVLVDADGNWTTTGTFSDSAAQVQHLSVNQIGGAQGQGEVDFTITLPAVATTPGGGTGGTGTGGTGTGGTGTGTGGTGTGTGTGATGTGTTGTGTATVTGTDPGAPALPVVSG